MKNNSSQIKDNNQSNFSSVQTGLYSSSLISSPFKDRNLFNRERLISEPKYSNENIFEKKLNEGLGNINQYQKIKQRNSGLYITSLGNVSDMHSENQKSIMTTNECTNASKPITNKNKRSKLNKSQHSLPFIMTNLNQNEDLIPISPIFSCCNQENTPKLLNKILYRQKLQEQKTNIYKSPGNENKFINSKPKKVTVKDGPKNYISKTRELNRLKYYMNLKIETIKDYYYDYRQEIKNIDFTINSIKAYKNNLESKFINEYVSQLRTLNKITLNERLKEEQQRNEIVRLKKDISMMMYNKKRLEITKFLIEKWIGLQIYIKDKVRVEDKQIKKYLNKNYKDQTIFRSSEEFEEFFKKKEVNNLRLIKTLNIKTEEKAGLFKELKNLELSHLQGNNYLLNMISEKETLLKLLKIRNAELVHEKKEVAKLKNHSSFEEKLQSKLTNITFTPKKEKQNEKTKTNPMINYNILYPLIQKTFDYIISNDSISLSESEENFKYINHINMPSTKALAQMKLIEMSYTFLVFYKKNNIKKNDALYKQLLDEIEQNHKNIKAEKYRKEEELKQREIHKKMEEKKNRILFKPTREDIYSSLIYIEKIKAKERKKKKNIKRKIDIFDLLYDIDDDKINNV